MTTVHLVKAVSDAVRAAVKRYRLPVEGEDQPRAVTVYEQTVPEEVFAETYEGEYHPYVAVSLESLDDDNQSEASLNLTVSIYGLERTETAPDGTKYRVAPWVDLFDLVDTVRLHMLSHRLIAQRFRLLKPATVEIPAVQPVPYWEAGINLRYSIYQPQDEIHCSIWRKK